MTFNPFESRICRDVRNQLGTAFINAIKKNRTTPFDDMVKKLKSGKLPDAAHIYIKEREQAFHQIMAAAYSPAADLSFFDMARMLWDAQLYFEMHEWLEHRWSNADGEEKSWLQALVLTAIAFEHFAYKRFDPARKLACKAVAGIEKHKSAIPDSINIAQIILRLKQVISS